MNAVVPATSHQEMPVWFEAGEQVLFGVVTTPRDHARGVGVIIVPGGGTPLSTNVNGLSVRLCRAISAYGFHGFRFDYHGAGESTGTLDRFNLAEPFVLDVEAATRCLRDRGVQRFVLVGSCFGARTVLAAAPDTEGVVAVILICPPPRDFEMGEQAITRMVTELTAWDYVRRAMKLRTLKGLMHVDRRRIYAKVAREKLRHVVRFGDGGSRDRQARYAISPRFLEPLRVLAERELPISIIYGDSDDYFADFERARSGPLGKVLETARTVELSVLPGKIHGFTSVEAQDEVLELVSDRLIRLPRS